MCEIAGPLPNADARLLSSRAFKFLDQLSGVATYPSGARRRAGASGDRAIAIAARGRAAAAAEVQFTPEPRRLAREPCP